MVAWSFALRGTKINSTDPPLPAVLASYLAAALIDQMTHPSKHATDSRSCSSFGSTLAAVHANSDT